MRVAEVSEHNKEINGKLEKRNLAGSSLEVEVELAKLRVLQDISQSLAMLVDKK